MINNNWQVLLGVGLMDTPEISCENPCQQYLENRSAHVATIRVLAADTLVGVYECCSIDKFSCVVVGEES